MLAHHNRERARRVDELVLCSSLESVEAGSTDSPSESRRPGLPDVQRSRAANAARLGRESRRAPPFPEVRLRICEALSSRIARQSKKGE
jgi:hypothetical protein